MIIAAASAGSSQSADGDFDPVTGYRIARYRAPVTEDVTGARRVDFEEVERLAKSNDAVFVDVMAAEGGGVDPQTGAWRMIKPRTHIPGSHWLPDVGRGALDAGMESYFQSNLARLTGGDKSRTLVIYCLADCWMGWNAARRAVGYGYTNVLWYPEGTDGWRDWDGILVAATPIPMDPADAGRTSRSMMRSRSR